MAIKRAVLKGRVIPAPQVVDDEAYLRLGVPSGTGARTDGKQPTTCSPISYEGMPHNNKFGKVMSEFKHGTLHSGSKRGPRVRSRQQAKAIAVSESKKAGEY